MICTCITYGLDNIVKIVKLKKLLRLIYSLKIFVKHNQDIWYVYIIHRLIVACLVHNSLFFL